MKTKSIFAGDPVSDPRVSQINLEVITQKVKYTLPKIFIPKVTKNGRKYATVAPNKKWYVYYYYRNPQTGLLQKFTEKRGINRLKTVALRKQAAENLKKAVLMYLQDGYSPFEYSDPANVHRKTFTFLEALESALHEKMKVWSQTTQHNSGSAYKVFKNWVIDQRLADKDIGSIEKRHIVLFLNYLTDKNGRNVNAISRNNYRRLVSTLFGQMVSDGILETNIVATIPKLKENPQKNKPYTKEQLKDIKKYLLKNDPYLFKFIQFVMYAFLREVEICRLQVKDIDLKNSIIKVKTKTESTATILIIDTLRDVIKELDISKAPAEANVFSNENKPKVWETARERYKVNHFLKRFKKVKNALNIGDDQSIYSFRHTAALSLYQNFKDSGLTDLQSKHKLMTITRHKSLSGLENYLRDIGASLPKDYSDNFTIDF